MFWIVTDLPERLKQDIVLVMNLSAAFNTVNYEVLLQWLHNDVGVRERLLIGLSLTYGDASERPN